MATSKTIDLGEFEDQKIAGTTIALRGAGDGLSQAMKVDPVILHHGQTVYVVYEARVIDVQHPEIKDSNEVTRKHILKAGTATLVDGSAVVAAIAAQADRIQAARDAETGARALELEYDPLGVGTRASDEDQPPKGQRAARAKKPAAAKPAKSPAKKGPAKPRKPRAKKATHLSSVPPA